MKKNVLTLLLIIILVNLSCKKKDPIEGNVCKGLQEMGYANEDSLINTNGCAGKLLKFIAYTPNGKKITKRFLERYIGVSFYPNHQLYFNCYFEDTTGKFFTNGHQITIQHPLQFDTLFQQDNKVNIRYFNYLVNAKCYAIVNDEIWIYFTGNSEYNLLVFKK